MAEGQKQTKEVKERTRTKILQLYLPINYVDETKLGRRQFPQGGTSCSHRYASPWGGMEAGLEANAQEIDKQQGILKTLLFTLHI